MNNNDQDNVVDLKLVAFDKYKAIEVLANCIQNGASPVKLLHLDALRESLMVFTSNQFTDVMPLCKHIQSLKSEQALVGADIEQLQQHIERLEGQYTDSKVQLDMLALKKSELSCEVQNNQIAIASGESELTQMEEALAQHQHQLDLRDQLRSKYAEHLAQKDSVAEDIIELQNKLEALPHSLKEQIALKEILDAQLATQEDELMSSKQQNQSLEQQIEGLESSVSRLSQELNDKQQNILDLEQNIEQQQRDIASSVNERKEAEKKLQLLRQELEEYVEADGVEALFIKEKTALLKQLVDCFSPNSNVAGRELMEQYGERFGDSDDERTIGVLRAHFNELDELENNRAQLIDLQEQMYEKIAIINREYRIKSASQQDGLRSQLEVLRMQADDIITQFKLLSEHFNTLDTLE